MVFEILAMLLFALVGAVVGIIAGWLVSIAPVVGPLVKQGFSAFGIPNANLVAIGAMLGFVAGFFRGSCGRGGRG